MSDNPILRPVEKCWRTTNTTDKRRVGNPAIWRLGRGLNPLILADFTDNPNSTARRNWRARWESNPHLPNCFGCSIAVELRDCPRGSTSIAPLPDAVLSRAQRKRGARQVTMDKWRDRTEALHAGNRTRSRWRFSTDATPSLWWRITDQLRPIEIGVTNRIRTGTNAFTGRDAAVTS